MPIETLKSIVDYGVIGLLVILSILTFTFAIERFIYFSRVNLRSYKSKKILELDLEKNLGTIATIGSSAPYIGLLGTVLAIILTFYAIGEQQNSLDTGEIMKHLALALKATAAGLVVAIPATVFYNILMDRADRLLTRWEILYGENG
jgi:biopolymer transport protein ExbB